MSTAIVWAVWITGHLVVGAPVGAEPWPQETPPPNVYEAPLTSPAEAFSGPSPSASVYGDVLHGEPASGLLSMPHLDPLTTGRFDPIRFPLQAGDVFSPLVPWDAQTRSGWRPVGVRGDPDDWYRLDVQVRGFYVNDQRIEWSGMEETFGAEGALLPMFRHQFDCCELIVLGELYLNQPFDRNVLVDTAERRSYAGNFEAETLQISQLYLAVRRDNLELAFGKMVTPFGRTYFPLLGNKHFDAPFIRSEVIHWRETGLLLRYDPAWLVCDLAFTNGSEDLDSNSSKALVSRIGFRVEQWAGGLSIKWQDGIGSENQKHYNNHLGADLMHRWGMFTLSSEVVFDEYGFRRPDFDRNGITWGRSIYYRDLNKAWSQPVTGVGYYLNLGLQNDRWLAALCYGEFYPKAIGEPRHDITIRRGVIKLDYQCARQLDAYTALILETGGYIAQDNRPRNGAAILAGLQYAF